MEIYIKLSDAVNAIRANGVYGEGHSDEERENDVIDTLESLPTFKFEKVGRWKDTTYTQCVGFENGRQLCKPVLAYECSECGKLAHSKHNFCKACGAKMEI